MGTYNTFFTSELSLSYILYSYILQFILQYISVHIIIDTITTSGSKMHGRETFLLPSQPHSAMSLTPGARGPLRCIRCLSVPSCCCRHRHCSVGSREPWLQTRPWTLQCLSLSLSKGVTNKPSSMFIFIPE